MVVNSLQERARRQPGHNVPSGMAWRQQGSCAGSDATVFYPPPDDDTLAEQAKEICAMCPVLAQCRDFALTTREKHGVWGGLTERERRRVIRQNRRSA